jgi:hypothetical protein
MLRTLGRREEALTRYQRARTLKPDLAEAHCGEGSIYAENGQRESALVSLEQALRINPHFVEAHNNRGVVLASMGLYEKALASYQCAINAKPDYAEAYYNRAGLLRERGQLEAALVDYNRAIACKAEYPHAYFNRGLALQELKRPEAALESYDEAIKMLPDLAEAHLGRGAVLIVLGRGADALINLERAIALRPDYAEAYYNRGRVLIDGGMEEEALESYEHAIRLKPDFVAALVNSGFIFGSRLQFAEALERYDRAIALDPNNADAHFNKATLLLLSGDFAGGWIEHEWRWQYTKSSPSIVGGKRLDMPLWLGNESIEGKTILLHDEQGLGDTIQFCRYAKRAAEAGANVILVVRESLLGIMSDLEGVARTLPTGIDLPECDFHCPLMSLPLAFNTTLESIPAEVPYLKCNPQKLVEWREMLGEADRLRVGLVWSGGFRANQPEMWSINQRRNIPLAKFAPLRHPGIEFYSLQKGQPAESELVELMSTNWNGPQLIDFTAGSDMADIAALIQNLDLIISVDTSIAHLAGALGKPVWILIRFDTDWRWLLDGSASPWYPTARLYRQARPGDWDGVIHNVVRDLNQVIADGAPGRGC